MLNTNSFFIKKNIFIVWLQVAYALSGLPREEEIRQVQFVAYLNGDKNGYENGGDFVYWPNGPDQPSKSVPAVKNAALITDGVHIAHGVTEWHPKGIKQIPPKLQKDDLNTIQYIGDNKWQIFINGKPSKM